MIVIRPALFTSICIKWDTVLEGPYLYKVRGNDDSGFDTVQIAKGILANHFGSIIVRETIDLPQNGYLDINPDKD